MSFSDPEFVAKYEKYMEKQCRVSDWVSQTSSSCYPSTAGSHVSKSRRPSRASETSSSTKTGKHSRKVKANQAQYISATSLTPVNPLPAIVGLVSSSLFVMTFLPSILTLLTFALLITCATVMDQREKDRGAKPESQIA